MNIQKKKYITPEFEVNKFESNDILLLSKEEGYVHIPRDDDGYSDWI